jgi:hypothetical protein
LTEEEEEEGEEEEEEEEEEEKEGGGRRAAQVVVSGGVRDGAIAAVCPERFACARMALHKIKRPEERTEGSPTALLLLSLFTYCFSS